MLHSLILPALIVAFYSSIILVFIARAFLDRKPESTLQFSGETYRFAESNKDIHLWFLSPVILFGFTCIYVLWNHTENWGMQIVVLGMFFTAFYFCIDAYTRTYRWNETTIETESIVSRLQRLNFADITHIYEHEDEGKIFTALIFNRYDQITLDYTSVKGKAIIDHAQSILDKKAARQPPIFPLP